MLTHVFNLLSDMLRYSKSAGWNGDDSSVLPAHALPSPRKRLCMEKVVLCMLTLASHSGSATPGGHSGWALPAPVARRGCDLDVSLGMKIKPSEPAVVVLG